MITKALVTPSYGGEIDSYVGGERRNKPRRCRGRISPRCFLASVTIATGMLWFVSVLLMPKAGAAAEASSVQAAPAQALPNPGPAPRPPAHGGPVTGQSGQVQAPVLQGANPAASQAQSSVTPDSANPPKKWPGPVQLLSPSASLDRKSKVSVGLVKKFRDRDVKPSMGPRGEVRFIYGATEDTVVCAPLRLCDIALQAGEIVQNVNLGDPTMWSCPPAISGSGLAEITHLMCKPTDAGLSTSLAIQTSRRTYSINLVSTRTNYMPRVGWTYPEDQASQWAAYQQRGGSHPPMPIGGQINYSISGDNPAWRPIVAFSDGTKTYIRFPPSMAYGQAPVLERLP